MTTARRLALIALAVLALGTVTGAAMAWHEGYRLYAVTSGSMVPALGVGDLIVTEPAAQTYRAGDIVTYPSGPGAAQPVTTHRVVAVTGELLETRGDANLTSDPVPVGREDVLGRTVASVTGAGYVLVFFQQPAGIAALAGSILTFVLMWDIFFGTAAAEPRRGEGGARAEGRRAAEPSVGAAGPVPA